MTKRRIAAISVFVTVIATSAANTPAPAQTAPATTSSVGEIAALRDAKTIRVTETCSLVVNSTKMLTPCAQMDIIFAQPNRYRVGMTYLIPGMSQKPSLLVSDGAVVSEYMSLSNQYLTRTVSNDPGFRLSKALSVDTLAELDLISNSFRSLLTPRDGVTYATSQTVLNGSPTTLIDATPPLSGENRSAAMSRRLWRDAKSGLPVRYESYRISKGQETIVERIDYTNWIIDKPVTTSTFTWTAPTAATAYRGTELLSVGTPAPNFTAFTPQGKIVHLSDFKNKVIVLDFWATWCHPCQEAMPHLESLYRQIKDKQVVVLALCVMDKKADYDKWVVAKKGIYTFPTVFDTAGAATANIPGKYGVNAIPAQYVIDKNGNIAFASTGYQKGNSDLEKALARLDITTTTSPNVTQ